MGREASQQLPSSAVESISARLAELPWPGQLRLPGNMTREGASPSTEARRGYLTSLLLHDPGVFLERHAELLDEGELAEFEALRWVRGGWVGACGRAAEGC